MPGNTKEILTPEILQYLHQDVCNIGGFERSKLLTAEPGRFEMKVFPGPDCANNVGTVHGGFLLAVADIAASGACDTYGRVVATMTLAASFLQPCYATDEYLVVTGSVLHYGKKSAVAEVEIHRPNGQLAFKATSTLAVFDKAII